MNIAAIAEAVVKVVDLISRMLPKRKPKPPKFSPIKITPKKPIDPHEEKRK